MTLWGKWWQAAGGWGRFSILKFPKNHCQFFSTMKGSLWELLNLRVVVVEDGLKIIIWMTTTKNPLQLTTLSASQEHKAVWWDFSQYVYPASIVQGKECTVFEEWAGTQKTVARRQIGPLVLVPDFDQSVAVSNALHGGVKRDACVCQCMLLIMYRKPFQELLIRGFNLTSSPGIMAKGEMKMDKI